MRAQDWVLALGLVVLGILTRLVPHPANFTAVAALALWSTTLFDSRKAAVAIPISVMVISDLILGFDPILLWVYGAFLLIVAFGLWLRPRVSWSRTVAGSLVASGAFFAITNFGVWASGELYPLTASGLTTCYLMGLPFLKNQIVGDLFCTVLFGVAIRYLVVKRQSAALATGRF